MATAPHDSRLVDAEHFLGADAAPEVADDVHEAPPEVALDSWAYTDLATLPERDPLVPDLAPGIIPLLYRGKRHVFSGPPESIKSLTAYYQALCVLRAGGTVLILDLEMDAYDARDMLANLGASPTELAAVAYMAPEDAPPEDALPDLVAEHYDLVVIDAAAGAYSYSGLDDNARKDVEAFHRIWLAPFHHAGTATLVLDHVVKNARSRGAFSIGSERKVGATDVHVGFDTVRPLSRGGHGIFKLLAHKDRPAGLRVRGCANRLGEVHVYSEPEPPHALTIEHRPPTEAGEERPTVQMPRVWQFVSAHEGCSKRSVREGVTGGNKGIDWALDVLVREEYLRTERGARNANCYYAVRPYEEDEVAAEIMATLNGETEHHVRP